MRQANELADAPGETVVFDRIHLFPNRPDVRWERRVHEQVLPVLERTGATIVKTGVVFQHDGYRDPATHRRKAERNLRLLQLEQAERPDDDFTLFNLAWTLHNLGRVSEAAAFWPRCRALAPDSVSYLRKLYSIWSRDLHALGRADEAMAVCREGRGHFPDDAELTFLEALLLRERGDDAGAEGLIRRLLASADDPVLSASVNLDLARIKAPNQLAEICAASGRDAEAERIWRLIAAERPGYQPAWRGLSALYEKHGHAEAARQARAHLADPSTDPRFLAAEAALRDGRVDEAEAAYRALLAEDLLPGVPHFRLGQMANRKRDFDAASWHHRRSIELDPALASKITPAEYAHHSSVCPPKYDVEEVVACPVCSSTAREPVMVVNCMLLNSYHPVIDPIRRWVACLGCGHGYADPRPGQSALAAAYRDVPPAHLQTVGYDQFVAASEIVERLWRLRPGGTFLDVGTAQGILAGVAREFGYEVLALDVHAGHEASVRAFGVEFLAGDLTNVDLGSRRFDVVALGDVIEHLADPRAVVRLLDRHLRPDGIAWVSTPNRDGAWTRRMGDRDPMWLESEHLQFFTRSSLTRLVAEAGFSVRDDRLSRRYVGGAEYIVERVGRK